MIYSHSAEVHSVIFAAIKGMLHLLELGFEIGLAFQTSGHHTSGDILSLLSEKHEILFDAVEFGLENLLLDFGRLGYHSELFVCQNDGVPVVVLDLSEDLFPFLGCKVFLARI